MSKQRILMIVALCFVLVGTVAAGIPHEPKPDSVVACLGAFNDPMGVSTYTVPVSIDSTVCINISPDDPALCSPCIRSLENQGCDVLDVDVSLREIGDFPATDTVFVLSCARP
jgi:hypothetical protein